MKFGYSAADFGEQAYDGKAPKGKPISQLRQMEIAETKSITLEVGQEIQHKVFGPGTVQEITDGIAKINFNGKIKKLMLEALGGSIR